MASKQVSSDCSDVSINSCGSMLLQSQQLTSMFATLKIEEAAKELGMGVTALKKQCRQHGIYRWPHRQVETLLLVPCDLKGSSAEEFG